MKTTIPNRLSMYKAYSTSERDCDLIMDPHFNLCMNLLINHSPSNIVQELII